MKTQLIALISLIFIGCAKLPPFPEMTHIYEVDTFNKVCVRYKVIETEPLRIAKESDLPLKDCEGLVGLNMIDVQNILFWKVEVKDWASKNCSPR